MQWIEIMLLVIVAIALGISLFYVTKGAADIGRSDDPGLESAHKYLTWTAVLGWIAIAFVIIGIGVFLFFIEELIFIVGGWIVLALLLLIAGMTIGVGVLAAIAASKISGSAAYSDSTNVDYDAAVESRKDTIIAASVSLGTVGLIIIAIIVYYTGKKKKEHEVTKAKSNIRKVETQEALEKRFGKSEKTQEE